jgi:hypothetical protein
MNDELKASGFQFIVHRSYFIIPIQALCRRITATSGRAPRRTGTPMTPVPRET